MWGREYGGGTNGTFMWDTGIYLLYTWDLGVESWHQATDVRDKGAEGWEKEPKGEKMGSRRVVQVTDTLVG